MIERRVFGDHGPQEAAPLGRSEDERAGSGSLSEEPIDLGRAMRVVDGDRVLLEELVRGFLEGLPARMTGLAEAIRVGDHKRTELAAHNLKGMLEALGSSRAHRLLQDLEVRAREGWSADTVPSLEDIERALAEIIAFFSTAAWRQHP